MTKDDARSMANRALAPTLPALALAVAATLQGAPAAAAERGTAASDPAAKQQTVLITGANRGLGYEFARQYATAGWRVIGTARKPTEAAELAELGARVMELDVASPASIERFAAELGEAQIDLLINNAGIFPRFATLAETDFEDVERMLAVNTIGPMRVTRALLPNLRRGTGKTIVSISSGLGSIANNDEGRFYGYRESKAGLNMFTRSLAAELEDEGFSCVVMSPGWVQTDMGGPNATLTPEQSIRGMRKVITGLTPAVSGTFWNHDGERLPW
jgi:NAD(P)-dependent dehydrogenase (short-subunit alcohol dehydrogenase family)